MRKLLLLLSFLSVACASTRTIVFEPIGAAELWMPGVVSTERSEVRLAISPDGNRMLWGVLEWPAGPGKWEIVEIVKVDGQWSEPHVVSFDSDANDFDPSFDPGGKGVYFFSNREGGLGKDDLYFAALDPATGMYGAPMNLGPHVNSAGDEWAPVVSPNGKELMFASDGRGGRGKHDLFHAFRSDEGWTEAVNLEHVNTDAEDFDATFLDDGRSIVLSSGSFDGKINLYFVPVRNAQYGARVLLGDVVNSTEPDAWTFGPSVRVHEPGVLYFTSHHAINAGRADIYRIRYALAPRGAHAPASAASFTTAARVARRSCM